jgi:hypothetical protein
MLRVHIVCCFKRRFCSSEARPSQYGSWEEVDVRGGVGCVIFGRVYEGCSKDVKFAGWRGQATSL